MRQVALNDILLYNVCCYKVIMGGVYPYDGLRGVSMRTVKKIWGAVTTLLVVAVVLMTLALVGVRLVGLQPYVVLSGSMEPTYPVGSLIYVQKVDPHILQVGDPITYMVSDNTVVTHRIIQVLEDETEPGTVRFFTQGDANDIPDAVSVHYRNVLGKPVFSLPYLGYVSNYIQNPPGTYVAICAALVLLMMVFLPDILFRE